ncbi:hypothetical protein VIGAN_08246500, partial [Vigna angularis var. angularis]
LLFYISLWELLSTLSQNFPSFSKFSFASFRFIKPIPPNLTSYLPPNFSSYLPPNFKKPITISPKLHFRVPSTTTFSLFTILIFLPCIAISNLSRSFFSPKPSSSTKRRSPKPSLPLTKPAPSNCSSNELRHWRERLTLLSPLPLALALRNDKLRPLRKSPTCTHWRAGKREKMKARW